MEYMDCYNIGRVKVKPNGLPPAIHGQQAIRQLEQFVLKMFV